MYIVWGGTIGGGQANNSAHCIMHYLNGTHIRFDLNYWGIGGALYNYITPPISGNWIFICIKGYIDGANHNLISYGYIQEPTLSESNIQVLTNNTNWCSGFDSVSASNFSIVLGQFESPLNSNYPFITSNNNISDTSKHKYIKHFGIYNSNIPYNEILEYFNATKNNLS